MHVGPIGETSMVPTVWVWGHLREGTLRNPLHRSRKYVSTGLAQPDVKPPRVFTYRAPPLEVGRCGWNSRVAL